MTNQNLSRAEAAARSAALQVDSYEVSLDLRNAEDQSEPGFLSKTVITFSCSEPDSTVFVDFIHGGVHSVLLNGRPLDPAEVVDGSRILLPGLEAQNQATITGTALYSTSGEGMHRFVDPADGKTYLYTQYEPADARRVFANFEQPDLKASFTFHVAAPDSWTVASNAAVASTEPLASTPGHSVRRFEPTQRISTYITTVLAGPYHAATDRWHRPLPDGGELRVPLGAYCRASLADAFDPDQIFAVTKAGLDFFHDLFDYPYPFGKYEQAFVPEYNLGAMENPGLVTFTEAYVFSSRATDAQYQARANTILHEMAHMWFGDLVTMKWWDDLWLKESFADYMGALASAEATQWSNAWITFANRRKGWAYVQDQLPTTHPIVADIHDLEAAKQNFDGITYAKGASVLKQLVAYAGFDSFIGASRRYFREHAYGNTSLADFLAALSAASGRDMEQWAHQWLQTAGISTLALDLNHDGGAITAAAIVQHAVDPVTDEPAHRPHRLRLGFYNPDASGRLLRTDQLELDAAGPRTELPQLAGRDLPALLLLNDDDLTYAKVVFDQRSLHTVLSSLDRLDDPLARALCWSSLWNMARDGLLPAAAYVEAVQRFAPAETENSVLQVVLDCAKTAMDRYAPAAHRPALRQAFLAAARRQVEAADAGSDQQLTWARALAAVARAEDSQAPFLRDLVEGRVVVDGLTVDTDLRWRFWQALAATGHAAAAELDAALEGDRTVTARAGHLAALTARPDPAVKAEAWRTAVDTDSLSNQLLDATIDGFCQGPPALLGGYVDPYFAELVRIWSSKSIEIAARLVRGLYPAGQDLAAGQTPAGHPVVVRTDAWLDANSDAPAALRRIVIEQRDHLLRALRAQQAGTATESGG
ncbi:aminopeptidase N [Arthrobacter sulfonylureivorans]|uniref:aminopeptidase N n=1 Tax=Arthrobacter sulfonylureivorans TaxID=2486855 RepID=UPI0039E68312